MNLNLNKIDVLILCGGRGSRLGSITGCLPKAMVKIKGYPFLDYIISYIKKSNFKRIILCTGYMSNKIVRYYKNKRLGLDMIFSNEKDTLGTAGAIKNAENLIRSNPFIVMNGDTFCRISFREFLKFHSRKRAKVSLAITSLKKIGKNFGIVKLDKNNRIVNFKEKVSVKDTNFVNAGTYLFNKEILEMIPRNHSYSIEHQLFSHLRDCFGFITKSDSLIDVGTTRNYRKALKIIPELNLI